VDTTYNTTVERANEIGLKYELMNKI